MGNSYDFKHRGLDARIARFRSVDPITSKYPWNSPYDFAEDRVIDGKDLEGLEYAAFGIGYGYAVKAKVEHKPFDDGQMAKDLIQTFGAGAIGLGVTADAIFTGGTVTKFVLGAQVAGALMHDNKSPSRLENQKRDIEARNTLGWLVFGYGIGKFTEQAVNTLGPLTDEVDANIGERLKGDKSFMNSATKMSKNDLTAVGRALQKHAGREGSSFADIKFSGKTGNQQGLDVLNEILDSKDQIIKSSENGTKTIFDKGTGRGVNVSRNGEFNGFRDMKQETK